MADPQCDTERQRDQRCPLLSNRADDSDNMSPMQEAIDQTYQSTGHLAKLLPSGTIPHSSSLHQLLQNMATAAESTA
jgi:hypothetical protein